MSVKDVEITLHGISLHDGMPPRLSNRSITPLKLALMRLIFDGDYPAGPENRVEQALLVEVNDVFRLNAMNAFVIPCPSLPAALQKKKAPDHTPLW